MANDRNDSAGYLGWFLLGGILGAASALMLAPKVGREIRDQLLERGGEFARRAQEMANDAPGRAGDWLDKTRRVVDVQTPRLLTPCHPRKHALNDDLPQ